MLGIIAFVLGLLWILGFFVFHIGGYIHVLLAAAVILTMVRISKNPVR